MNSYPTHTVFSSIHNTSLTKKTTAIKCMLMLNDPLPDFHIQWMDSTRLKYALSTSEISIDMVVPPNHTSNTTTTHDSTRDNNSNNRGEKSPVKRWKWEGKLILCPQETSPISSGGARHLLSSGNRLPQDQSDSRLYHEMFMKNLLHIPDIFRPKILEAQMALIKCLQYDRKVRMTEHQSSSSSSYSPHSIPSLNMTSTFHPQSSAASLASSSSNLPKRLEYPVIIVDNMMNNDVK
jgi:hypothetical protein